MARVSPAQSPGSWLWLRCHRVTGSCAWQAGGSQGAASFWQAAAWESLGDGRAQALRGGGALPRACLLRGAVPTRLGSGCCHPRRNQGPHQRLGRLRAHRDSDPRRTCVRVAHRAASQGPCSVPARVRAAPGCVWQGQCWGWGDVGGGDATIHRVRRGGWTGCPGRGRPGRCLSTDVGRRASQASAGECALCWAGALATGRQGAGRSCRAGSVGGGHSAGAAPESWATAPRAGLQVM